jgi:hypothetical protein
MLRRIIGGLIAVAFAVAVPAVAAASGPATGQHAAKTVHVKVTLIGAQVGPNENVYDVRGPVPGAAVQFVKENSAGTGGTYTGTTYNGLGTLVSAGTFTNSTPDSHGLITINGSGHWVRGTGAYKHVRGKFTVSGTLNTANGHLKVLLVGTETY